MTDSDLEAVVARTGHERFRWLTSDANPDAASREGFRRIVRAMAGGEPEPGPPAPPPPPAHDFAELRSATKLGSARCWFSEKVDGCGCSGFHCHLLARRINIYDCVDCLKRW